VEGSALEHAHQVAYVDQLLQGTAAQVELLHEAVEALRGSAAALAVSEKAQQPQLTTDFPFAGSHRWLIPRQPSGGLVGLEAGKVALVLAANANRLGGFIVNRGAKAADLFLCDEKVAAGSRAAIARVGLAAGASWDCRLGPNLLWSGSIAGLAAEATELTVAEV
jgi:hypothetical protein